MQDKRYNNDEYRRARAAGGGRPDASLSDTVAYIMRFMLGEGLIPRAVRRAEGEAPATPARDQAPRRKAT
jgi:hypothetical protein